MNYINLFYFFTIFIFTNILIKISIPLMGNIFKDVPNERSSHKYIKLKSGGISPTTLFKIEYQQE